MVAQGRTGARRLLLQAFYQAQLSGDTGPVLLKQFSAHPNFSAADGDYFEELLGQVEGAREVLDKHIGDFGHIPAAQLDPVERAVLWIALAEFCFQPEVPTRVILNEAVELAKCYGAEGGYRYVNGLLDKASANLRSPER
jgi:N utilization substance protein B